MAQCQMWTALAEVPSNLLGQLTTAINSGFRGTCIYVFMYTYPHIGIYSKIELGGVVHSKPDIQEAEIKGLPFEFEPKLGHIHNKTMY